MVCYTRHTVSRCQLIPIHPKGIAQEHIDLMMDWVAVPEEEFDMNQKQAGMFVLYSPPKMFPYLSPIHYAGLITPIWIKHVLSCIQSRRDMVMH